MAVLQAQHWLVTSYADISPESAASREYSLQKLLSRMEAGVGAALMPSSVAGATMDALPDGFRIPMCKDVSEQGSRGIALRSLA